MLPRLALVALVPFLTAACAGGSVSHAPEPVRTADLLVHLDKTEFFEGEPIYAVIELHDSGTDTVRLAPFDLSAGWMRGTLRQDSVGSADGATGIIVDYVFPPKYGGDPLPPGASRFRMVIVQSLWGTGGPLVHALQLRRLAPGQYAMQWTLAAWVERGRALTPAVTSREVTFAIRSRTSSEDVVVREFETIGERLDVLRWQASDFDSVLTWSTARLAADSADPFVPVLIPFARIKAAVTQRGADSAYLRRALMLETAIVQARPDRAASAFVIGDVPAATAEQLGATLAGRIARARAARRN